jgi:hypothetical protein
VPKQGEYTAVVIVRDGLFGMIGQKLTSDLRIARWREGAQAATAPPIAGNGKAQALK